MFALRFKDTKELVSFDTTVPWLNDGGTVFELVALTTWNTQIWVTTNRCIAEKAANYTNSEYDSTFDRPVNQFVGNLEVVELNTK